MLFIVAASSVDHARETLIKESRKSYGKILTLFGPEP